MCLQNIEFACMCSSYRRSTNSSLFSIYSCEQKFVPTNRNLQDEYHFLFYLSTDSWYNKIFINSCKYFMDIRVYAICLTRLLFYGKHF